MKYEEHGDVSAGFCSEACEKKWEKNIDKRK